MLDSGILLFSRATRRATLDFKDSGFQNKRVCAIGPNPVAFVLWAPICLL
jgi:hypothetical protein